MFQNETTYNDDVIQVTHIDIAGVPLVAVASVTGMGVVLDASNNFFSPAEIVQAYRKLFPNWLERKSDRVKALKGWLIETQGCKPEELE